MGERFAEYMNITADMLPTVISLILIIFIWKVRIHWITDTEVRRYIYEEDISSDGLVEFYEKWKNGELKAVYKSEPFPVNNDKQLVKRVVGNNFD